jgi:hypothetical protein
LFSHSTGCVVEKEEAQMDEGVVEKKEISTLTNIY